MSSTPLWLRRASTGRAPVLLRLVAAVLLLSALWHWAVGPQQLLVAAGAADLRWVVVAAALLPVGLALQWGKWRALARPGMPGLREPDILRALLAGFALGLVTPGRLGELGRGVVLPGRRRAATALAAADRAVSAIVTVTVGGLGAALSVTGSAMVVALGAGVAAGATLGAWRWMRRRADHPWLQPLLVVPRAAWGRNVLGAVLFNLVFWGQFYCLLHAGGGVSLGAAAAIPAVFALKTLVPISFMDLGVREGAAVLVLGGLGVPAAVAANAALALFLINVLLPGACGLLYLSLPARVHRPSPPHPSGVEFAHVR